MHIAKFNCACLKTLKTGPAMAGLAGPTPTALKCHMYFIIKHVKFLTLSGKVK